MLFLLAQPNAVKITASIINILRMLISSLLNNINSKARNMPLNKFKQF